MYFGVGRGILSGKIVQIGGIYPYVIGVGACRQLIGCMGRVLPGFLVGCCVYVIFFVNFQVVGGFCGRDMGILWPKLARYGRSTLPNRDRGAFVIRMGYVAGFAGIFVCDLALYAFFVVL